MLFSYLSQLLFDLLDLKLDLLLLNCMNVVERGNGHFDENRSFIYKIGVKTTFSIFQVGRGEKKILRKK